MKNHVRLVSLSLLLVAAPFHPTFPFVILQIASANTSPSNTSTNNPVAPTSMGDRLDKMKGEIERLKDETENTLASIAEVQEKNRCLGVVYSSLTALTNQIDALDDRSTVASLANRTRELVKNHAAFFFTLNEFSRQNLLLAGESVLMRGGVSTEVSAIVDKASELIQNLREQYQAQANDEQRFLAEISATMKRLQRAGASAQRGLESTKQCAPNLIEKHTTVLNVGLTVLNNLNKARALIADLQLKRSRILGAFIASFQKNLSAQLAEASGQKADNLVSKMNASLAELSLRNDIERWWFAESVENGPARGFLSGEKENAAKASVNLRLAIANCDHFIARVRDIYSHPAFAEQGTDKSMHSALEVALYKRRAALGLWLEQANRSTTVSTR